jgi:DNA-binding response OmpR family regulator
MPGHINRIFVVDDEQTIASTLAAILRMNGFTAWFFTTPFEALAAAQSYRPYLLIADVVMPGLSGVELAISMSAQFPEMKILLFSGQAATSDLLGEANKRGHDFQLLGKPLHPAVLISRIRAFPAAESQGLNEGSHERLS